MAQVKSMKRPKKSYTVMQVIPNLGAGGAEQTCVDVTAALVQEGHRAIVVSNGGPRAADIKRAGGIHIELPVHSKNPLVMRLNAKRLKALMVQYNVDIVHARSRAPAWSCYWATRDTKTHFLTTCHAPFNLGGRLKNYYNSSITRGELIIANSDFVGHYLVDNYAVPIEKIRVIPRGIPMERFNPTIIHAERMLRLSQQWRIPEVATVILMPGRLTRWKGQTVMIEAMSHLKHKDTYCILLGDDQGRTEYTQELEQMIHDLQLEERVRISSHCNDMASAYALADIVVSASIEPEGFGRTAVEAQAMGKSVVATNIGGSRETIIPDVTGWLVAPDNPVDMARAIDKALSLDPDERAFMQGEAMRHVRTHFTKEQMTFATLEVYRELLSR